MPNVISLPTAAAVLDLDTAYRQAWLALTLAEVREWLLAQPLHRVVGRSRSATGGVLATYLAWVTPTFWCVSHHYLWRLHDAEALARPLPDWAVAFVRGEDRYGDMITVADALNLLDRLAAQPAAVEVR